MSLSGLMELHETGTLENPIIQAMRGVLKHQWENGMMKNAGVKGHLFVTNHYHLPLDQLMLLLLQPHQHLLQLQVQEEETF